MMTNGKPQRAWQRMLSGRRLDLLDPNPDDIEIEDIGHGLARVARWNGQTEGEHGFSVAQHSLFVLEVFLRLHAQALKEEQLAALLHDAPEYVIGDLISPFKAAIGRDYKVFETQILKAIFSRFDIEGKINKRTVDIIKSADQIAAYYEAVQLAGFSFEEAGVYFPVPSYKDDIFAGLSQILVPLPVKDAQRLFLEKFHSLYH